MNDFNIPIIEPTIDYTKVPPINQKRTIAFINHFIASTIIFLNKFSLKCEENLFELEHKLQRIEATLEILEARLSSIREVDCKLQPDNKIVEEEKKDEEVKQVEIIANEIDKTNIDIPTEDKIEDSNEKQPVSLDPEYAKYFKMIHFGVPKPAVKLRMEQEGLDSSMLDNPHQLIPKSKIDSNSEVNKES